MLDAFEVLMPAFKERVRGKLRPVLGARCEVLLLDGGAANGSLVASLFDELELYLQAAGMTCLRVAGQPHSGVARDAVAFHRRRARDSARPLRHRASGFRAGIIRYPHRFSRPRRRAKPVNAGHAVRRQESGCRRARCGG